MHENKGINFEKQIYGVNLDLQSCTRRFSKSGSNTECARKSSHQYDVINEIHCDLNVTVTTANAQLESV